MGRKLDQVNGEATIADEGFDEAPETPFDDSEFCEDEGELGEDDSDFGC
jgi:hypothetical protein